MVGHDFVRCFEFRLVTLVSLLVLAVSACARPSVSDETVEEVLPDRVVIEPDASVANPTGEWFERYVLVKGSEGETSSMLVQRMKEHLGVRGWMIHDARSPTELSATSNNRMVTTSRIEQFLSLGDTEVNEKLGLSDDLDEGSIVVQIVPDTG